MNSKGGTFMSFLKYKFPLKKSLPFITTFIIAVCFLLAIYNELNYERSALKASTKQELQIVAAKLDSLFTQSIETTFGLKSYFEENPDFHNPALEKFNQRLYGEHERIIKTFALTDGSTIKYIYPLKGNENALNIDLLSLPNQAVVTKKTLEDGTYSLLGPLKVIQGWEAFIFMAALNLAEDSFGPSKGLVTVTLDHNELLAESGVLNLLNKYEVQLVNVNPDFSEQVLFKSNQFKKGDSVSVEIFPYKQHWKLFIHPINGWEIRAVVIFIMTFTGIVISSGSYYLLYSLMRRNEQLDQLVAVRTKDLVWTNNELHESLALNEERQAELELLNERLEMTIVELKYTLQKLNVTEKAKVISDLIAGVAHRINTPIGNILSMVSFIKTQIQDYHNNMQIPQSGELENDLIASIDECIMIIDRSTIKAIGIMSNFEHLSSIKSQADFEFFNINESIDDAMVKLSPEINVIIDNRTNRECLIYSSKTILSQIIHSIILVLLEYRSIETETTIRFDVNSINGLCVLTIGVVGLNFPQEIIDKTFDPHLFIPANSKLTGLELFIAFQLACDVLGGDLKYSAISQIEHEFTLYISESCNKQ